MVPKNKKSPSPKEFLNKDKQTFLMPQGELELFRYMIDQIGDEVMVIHKSGRIVFANKIAFKKLGYSPADLLEKNITDLFHEKISAGQWQKKYFAELKKKKRPVSYVVNRVGKRGGVHTVDVTAVYMPYKSEEYVLSVARDITGQTALQNRLKESEDQYRLLSEQALDGIFLVDMKGAILYANKAAGGMFQCPSENLVGTRFLKYVRKDSRLKAYEHFCEVRSGKPMACAEVNILGKKGRILTAEFMASPVFLDEKVNKLHVTVRDVSRRKEVENLVKESEKTKALQNFIAGTTKEIQHPLKAVLTHSNSLVEKYKNRHFEYVGYKEFQDIITTLVMMRDQIKYCFDTTDRLLELNRRRVNLRGNTCDVNAVLRESLDSLKHSFEVSDIKFRLRLAAQLPPVAVGPLEFGEVVTNVLTNAIQALPRGGDIHLRTSYRQNGGKVCIECRDDGTGIPAEVLPRIFEPFFTTKHRGLEKSSGLGLAIVYAIVKAFQGEIVVKSKLRQGTLVQISFPVRKNTRKK